MLSDTLIRFEPAAERFTIYPLPTRVTYTREIDFDEGGGVSVGDGAVVLRFGFDLKRADREWLVEVLRRWKESTA